MTKPDSRFRGSGKLRCFAMLLLAFFCIGLAPAHAAPPLPAPTKLAVYAYADWCPNCKLLSPKLDAAKAAAGKQILFVKLDLTDKPRIGQSILLASALGIAPWFQQQGSATGYVAILDAATKKEVARFDSGSTADAIAKALQ